MSRITRAECPRHRACHRGRTQGFTLIELLVTIAIGVMLMVVAVPGFIDFRRNTHLSDAVSNFILASGTAKSAALKSGKNAFIAVNDTGAGWNSGWYVFLDNNWNDTYDVDTDEVLLRHEALSTEVVATTPNTTTLTDGYVLFNGSGFPRSKTGSFGNGTLVMKVTGRTSYIYIDTSGRVRSCRAGVDTGCPLT